jgi:hypothetical protein
VKQFDEKALSVEKVPVCVSCFDRVLRHPFHHRFIWGCSPGPLFMAIGYPISILRSRMRDAYIIWIDADRLGVVLGVLMLK